ncbi:hypothetical protein FD754_016913 [Muntiacus muntjak]|uniref:Beta-adaptin appendage C-terminal subdomain domain-containing protein n=1 Tax=Muntiacus muntjak TaxID=9888 RepID=A0A5N3VVG4_MUNMU|nr:hypothetical protein FD754_016913 [Muntiacus muntjak]
MTDSKYFTTNKRGEILELKAELNSKKKEKKKEAVKQVTAALTVGKDASSLSPDVVNYMQMDNLELKKLVYLYLMPRGCEDPNPLIQALVARTMGCIRVDKITEYLCEPLCKCLKDDDPYVRKIAAVCVAKLHDISAQVMGDLEFLDSLWDLISRFKSNALNECTEWGQIFILDCLSSYNPKDDQEAQTHANPAVVLSAVKVLMKFLELLPKDSDYYNMLLKKLAPPLITWLSGETEVQYKRPEILKQEIKVFFVKYNDPIYVKLEKLDIVLAELEEYATEVEADFVSKAAQAPGWCAIKVERSAERSVSTLLDLIQTKVNHVAQEAIVVIRDIFCKDPNKYESIMATLCDSLDSLDEPDARAAMIWIVGKCAERTDNADELLESFLEGFHDENTQVPLTLLIAIVQLFLKKLSGTQELVQQILNQGYIYWCLLSTDPITAKEVVLSEKPLISEETDLIEPTLLMTYHKPPNAFVEGSHGIHRKHLPIHHGSTNAGDSTVGTIATNLEPPQVIPSQGDLLGHLSNLDLGPPVNVPQVSSMQMGAVDLLGGGLDSLVGQSFIPSVVPATFAPSPTPAVVSSGLNDLCELSTGIGMAPGGYVAPRLSGTFTHPQGHIYMEMNFTSKALQQMIDSAAPLAIHTPLTPDQSIDVSLPLNTLDPIMKTEPLNNLQVAVQNNIDVFYFSCLIPLNVLFVQEGKMEHQVFLATWKDIPIENELHKLQNNNVYTIAKRNVEGQDTLYQSLKLTNGIWILAELRIQPGKPPEVSQYIHQVYDSILKN